MQQSRVIDKHSDNGSLLITSQYETNLWLNHFEDQTVGEALLDRIVHRSHIFNLAGESMRKNEVKKSSNFFIFVQVKRHFNLRISLLKCPTLMRMGVQVSVDFAAK
ncbi:ATP-binding protein [Acinetobacter johnsonii]|nr:ATP-binding protein [Acinetobacter johnsonii]